MSCDREKERLVRGSSVSETDPEPCLEGRNGSWREVRGSRLPPLAPHGQDAVVSGHILQRQRRALRMGECWQWRCSLTPGWRSTPFPLAERDAGAFVRGRSAYFPEFSPDARSIAYISDDAGQTNLYVSPFPGPGRAVQVSESGASFAKWSRDGRHLVYRTSAGYEEATIEPSPVLTIRSRKPFFFEKGYASDNDGMFDVMPDGNHLLMLKPSAGAIQVLVVTNWVEELRQRESSKPR